MAAAAAAAPMRQTQQKPRSNLDSGLFHVSLFFARCFPLSEAHCCCCVCLKVLAPKHLPKVYMQICLPDGQLRLHRVLHSMQGLSGQPAGLSTHSTSIHLANAAAGSAGQAAATGLTHTQNPAPGTAITSQTVSVGLFLGYRPLGQSAQPVSSDQAYTAVELGPYSPAALSWQPPGLQQQRPLAEHQQQQQQQAEGSSHGGSGAPEVGPAGHRLRQGVQSGCAFWQEFSAGLHVMCLAEIKYDMMAQSVVGVPGVMTLLCNLSTTVDFGLDTKEVCQLVDMLTPACDPHDHRTVQQTVWHSYILLFQTRSCGKRGPLGFSSG